MGHFRIELMVAVVLGLAGIIGLIRQTRSSVPRRPLLFVALCSVATAYMAAFKRFRIDGAARIPEHGPLILVANHTTAYDPVCLQVACRNRMIRFMEAREFYNQMPLTFIYRALRVIPVNRTGNDTASIRTAIRELSNNGCIGIFPEGRISDDGQLHEARQGVALLALLSGAPVVPAFIQGTGGYSGMVRDFFRLNRVTLQFGPAVRFDDLRDRHRDKDAREIALKRIMDALSGLAVRAETSANPNRKPLSDNWETSR